MNCLQELKSHYGPAEGYAIYRLIMEESFGLSYTDILLGKDSQISEENKARLKEITARLLENEPVQYVIGHTYFHGHRFCVRQGVLIPLPETELLVDKVLELAKSENAMPRILDIGTGSGCIAVSLALAGCDVTALDISEDALDVAKENATALGAEVAFVHENILKSKKSTTKPLNILSIKFPSVPPSIKANPIEAKGNFFKLKSFNK